MLKPSKRFLETPMEQEAKAFADAAWERFRELKCSYGYQSAFTAAVYDQYIAKMREPKMNAQNG